ncbi:hypothetical protein Pmani_015631 [Petrolisthes manimaculis]|uniref:Secreted protein n=1 Tax=Petrolisthes manimaculis TaxID=1843537 RepID=A0AAE1UBC4_9EUCA|nr:hypothetical protein Pmani_015631 [Petrolisthes manimaculis]
MCRLLAMVVLAVVLAGVEGMEEGEEGVLGVGVRVRRFFYTGGHAGFDATNKGFRGNYFGQTHTQSSHQAGTKSTAHLSGLFDGHGETSGRVVVG